MCSEKWQLNNYWPNHIKVSVWLLGYLCHYGTKQELRKSHGSVVTSSTETKPLRSYILPGNSPSTTGKASGILYSAKPHSSNSQTPDDSQDLPQTILTRQQCPPALHSLPQLYKFLIPFGKVTYNTEQNLKLRVGIISVYCFLIFKYSHMQLKTTEANGIGPL